MIVCTFSFTYDGEVLRGKSTQSPAGTQDLGLPSGGCVLGVRVPPGDGFELSFNIAELAEQLAADLLLTARKLQREREQLSFPGFEHTPRNGVDVRRVRRVVVRKRR